MSPAASPPWSALNPTSPSGRFRWTIRGGAGRTSAAPAPYWAGSRPLRSRPALPAPSATSAPSWHANVLSLDFPFRRRGFYHRCEFSTHRSARSVPEGFGLCTQAQMRCQSGCDYRKTGPQAGTAARQAGAESNDGNMLAGVIGAVPGRIVAMIGGDDDKITGSQPRGQIGQPGVETLKRGRITRDVAAMPIERVEVVEVGEGQASIRERFHYTGSRLYCVGVIRRLDHAAGGAMGEDIRNLADRDDRASGCLRPLQDGASGRGHSVIAPWVGGAKVCATPAGKRPCDHTPDMKGIKQLAGNATGLVQAGQ